MRLVWPANTVVAKAYLDQLGRTKGIQPERARAVTNALDKADKSKSAKDKTVAATELNSLATQLESDAGAATGRDAMRLKSLAATIKSRATALR